MIAPFGNIGAFADAAPCDKQAALALRTRRASRRVRINELAPLPIRVGEMYHETS